LAVADCIKVKTSNIAIKYTAFFKRIISYNRLIP